MWALKSEMHFWGSGLFFEKKPLVNGEHERYMGGMSLILWISDCATAVWFFPESKVDIILLIDSIWTVPTT